MTRLERSDRGWLIVGNGAAVDADAVVLANGIGAMALVPDVALPIRAGRGLVSHLAATVTPPMDIVVTRLGYVTPPVDGLRCAGATTTIVEPAATGATTPLAAEHAENLHRLDMMLPGFGNALDAFGVPVGVSQRGSVWRIDTRQHHTSVFQWREFALELPQSPPGHQTAAHHQQQHQITSLE